MTDRKFKPGRLALLLLIIVLFFAIMLCCEQRAALKQKDLLIDALPAAMVKHRDKDSAEITEKRLLLISYNQLKNIHASDSSEIGRLKKLVTKNTISATMVSTQTTGTLTGKPTVLFPLPGSEQGGGPDTTCKNYPTYKDSLRDKWAKLDYTVNKDTGIVHYTVFNEFEFKQNFKKMGRFPFKEKVPVITARNLNPNTITTGISSYACAPAKTKQKTTAVAFISAVAGFVLAVFILK